jgi:hypothetical protein
VIRIKRPTQAFAILRDRGTTATRRLCKQYDAEPEAYQSESKPKLFKFNSKIYGSRTVKNALRKAQHEKCALCESKVSHIAYGDVEHFRPKAGYRQKPGDRLVQPGYYRLAYEWANLGAAPLLRRDLR